MRVYVLTDFQCPVCRRIVEPLKYLARRHPNEVRLIVKQNALPSHRNATAFAAASMAAFRQGKFWPYHDRLFANAGAADEATLVGHAKVSNFVCTLMPATRRGGAGASGPSPPAVVGGLASWDQNRWCSASTSSASRRITAAPWSTLPATDGPRPASREEVHMSQFTKVASTADLAPGEAKCVDVAGKKLALFNVDGSFYAIDDTCTHTPLTSC